VSPNQATLEIGEAQTLFGSLIVGEGFTYDVSLDGQRFLSEVSLQRSDVAANDALILVQNWAARLKK
jgi:hypothetical protein